MSTHQAWESCQTLGGTANKNGVPNKQEKGTHSDMVPGIIKSGAHMAYLLKNPDDIDKHYKPLARITLNAFKSTTSGHTILRPSDEYGDHWEGFHSTVKNWSEKNFPAKDPEYIRHKGAYQEGESTIRNYGSEHNNYWKAQHYDAKAQENHPDHEVLNHYTDKAISDTDTNTLSLANLMRNKNLPRETEDKIVKFATNISDNSPHIEHFKSDIVKNVKSPEHIQNFLNRNIGSSTIANSAAQNDNATKDQLHHILDTHGAGLTNIPGQRELAGNNYSKSHNVLNSVIRNKNSDDSHFSKIMELKELNEKSNGYISGAMDHDNRLDEISSKYNTESVGKSLLHVVQHSMINHHRVISYVAEKHPHLLHMIDDNKLADAFRRHSLNKNLENECLRRYTPETLRYVATHTKDTKLLDTLENHPDEQVSYNAKLRKAHMRMFE